MRERAVADDLPGIKYGRDWVFPAEAVYAELAWQALEQAPKRRVARTRVCPSRSCDCQTSSMDTNTPNPPTHPDAAGLVAVRLCSYVLADYQARGAFPELLTAERRARGKWAEFSVPRALAMRLLDDADEQRNCYTVGEGRQRFPRYRALAVRLWNALGRPIQAPEPPPVSVVLRRWQVLSGKALDVADHPRPAGTHLRVVWSAGAS